MVPILHLTKQAENEEMVFPRLQGWSSANVSFPTSAACDWLAALATSHLCHGVLSHHSDTLAETVSSYLHEYFL